jgi:3-hydroxyacyl-[acyl-carrier-protein] dehydratase
MAVTTVTISSEHPALAGHFPGAPILPGVLLLDELLHALEREQAGAAPGWRIGSAKFLKPVRPGQTLRLEHERLPNGTVRFQVSSDGAPVAQGLLVPAAPADEAHHGGPSG